MFHVHKSLITQSQRDEIIIEKNIPKVGDNSEGVALVQQRAA